MVSVKPIIGFEGKYSVTKEGKIFSEIRYDKWGRCFGGKYLKHKLDRYGYPIIRLTTIDRKAVTRTIHRLVASTFIPNPNNLPTVNHKDGNKENNNISNLEWCTCKENTIHGWRIGLMKPYDRTKEYNRQGIIDSNKRRTKRSVCGI